MATNYGAPTLNWEGWMVKKVRNRPERGAANAPCHGSHGGDEARVA
jgi:hypothetical protein